MAWPTANANFIVNGTAQSSYTTTLQWGTDGLYGSAIVKSMRRANMAEEIKIENGTGLTAWFIQLIDGIEVEFTCVYDTAAVTASNLQIGDTISLIDPFTGGSYNFLVTQNPMNLARKQEAEFNISAKYFSTANVPAN